MARTDFDELGVNRIILNGQGEVVATDDQGHIAPGKLGSGAPDTDKFLRGDGTWAAPPTAEGGGGGGDLVDPTQESGDMTIVDGLPTWVAP